MCSKCINASDKIVRGKAHIRTMPACLRAHACLPVCELTRAGNTSVCFLNLKYSISKIIVERQSTPLSLRKFE